MVSRVEKVQEQLGREMKSHVMQKMIRKYCSDFQGEIPQFYPYGDVNHSLTVVETCGVRDAGSLKLSKGHCFQE